jgi:hypothetical protein
VGGNEAWLKGKECRRRKGKKGIKKKWRKREMGKWRKKGNKKLVKKDVNEREKIKKERGKRM